MFPDKIFNLIGIVKLNDLSMPVVCKFLSRNLLFNRCFTLMVFTSFNQISLFTVLESVNIKKRSCADPIRIPLHNINSSPVFGYFRIVADPKIIHITEVKIVHHFCLFALSEMIILSPSKVISPFFNVNVCLLLFQCYLLFFYC